MKTDVYGIGWQELMSGRAAQCFMKGSTGPSALLSWGYVHNAPHVYDIEADIDEMISLGWEVSIGPSMQDGAHQLFCWFVLSEDN
jgi:hypothetical protein